VKKNPAGAKEFQVGFLALKRNGEYGAYALQKGFSYAVRSGDTEKILDAPYHYH
jgi:N4-(beta-N-acetylglucosaminyl)-L-asparaginase